MSTEREREDANESANEDAVDRDESHDRDGDESLDASEGGAPESAATSSNPAEGDAVEGEVIDGPPVRNRSERRVVAKRERRGQPAEGNVDRNRALRTKRQADAESRALEEEERKIKLPARTISGKNSGSEEVPEWARSFVEWMSARRGAMSLAAAAVVIAAGGAVGFTSYQEQRAARAAAYLSEAVGAIDGTIRAADAPADPPGSPPRRGPTYVDHAARGRAALEAFRRAEQQPGAQAVMPLARLGEATALYDLGRYAEAKPIFEALVGQSLAGQESRALEGLAFCLEATNDLPGALRRFEELGRLHDGAHRDFATYQQARVLHRQNQDPRAKDLLHAMLERLNRSRPEDTASTNGVVHEQAQMLLREIDPTDDLARRRGGTPDTNALMRMLQQAGAGGAPGAAGGGH